MLSRFTKIRRTWEHNGNPGSDPPPTHPSPTQSLFVSSDQTPGEGTTSWRR